MSEELTSRYTGESVFLRIWPLFMAGLGGWLTWRGLFGVGIFLVLCGSTCASVLPWKYIVFDDGLALRFAFGKRRFLHRDQVMVRVDWAGGVAYAAGRRLGYPLSGGLVERQAGRLRAILSEHGYRIT